MKFLLGTLLFISLLAQAEEGTKYDQTGGSTGTPVYDYSSGSAVIVGGEMGESLQDPELSSEQRKKALEIIQQRQSGEKRRQNTFSKEDFINYQNRESIKNLIRDCRKRGEKTTIKGMCLMYLRKAMYGNVNGGVDWFGGSAAEAGPYLEKAGFINLLKIPEYKAKISGPMDKDIYPGAILQYDGTNSCKRNKKGKCYKKTTVPMGKGWGHIELFTGKDNNNKTEYCYDGLTNLPGGAGKFTENVMQSGTGRRTRKLIGVWVKPGA